MVISGTFGATLHCHTKCRQREMETNVSDQQGKDSQRPHFARKLSTV